MNPRQSVLHAPLSKSTYRTRSRLRSCAGILSAAWIERRGPRHWVGFWGSPAGTIERSFPRLRDALAWANNDLGGVRLVIHDD